MCDKNYVIEQKTKLMYTHVKPKVTLEKSDVRGSKLYRHVGIMCIYFPVFVNSLIYFNMRGVHFSQLC